MPTHEPVLPSEVLSWLAPDRGGLYVDCTVGLGGHSRSLLEAGATRLIGLDRDADALEAASSTLSPFGGRVELVHADYRTLPAVLDARGIATVDGVLADLGVSSLQLDGEGRGFSFRRDEPLDMRMDRSEGPTAADLVNRAPEPELADAIYELGEERYSRRVARAIVEARRSGRIASTGELAAIVRRAIPSRGYQRIDPATRTFQALRIWVNRELEGLDGFLRDTVGRLATGARFVVISFHSLEDRIVKHTFRGLERTDGLVRVLTKHPVVPGEDEIGRNPRARSAKLRVVERAGMEAFEYAIKKDIRNNAIVREIDRSRQRELWQWAAVGAFFVALLLANAWQHFELLRHGYAVEKMKAERVNEEEINRHLLLQKAALTSPTRIAELARRMHMAPPGPSDAIVLERATPAEPPAQSVVARR